MSSTASFVGSVPDLYERYLTPFLAPWFEAEYGAGAVRVRQRAFVVSAR